MPLIKEKKKKRGVKSVYPDHVKMTQCIQIQGNQQAASNIAKNYLAEFPEVANWEADVEYSQNKNNRWKIAQSLKDTFTNNKEDLEQEDVNVFAVVVPDPNLSTPYSQYKRNPHRYFMSSEPGVDVAVGKARSHIPHHEFDAKKDVKFHMEDEAMDKINKRGAHKFGTKIHGKKSFYIGKSVKGKKVFHYNEESEEEEVSATEDEVEDEAELDLESDSPKQISLKDFFRAQSPTTKDKPTTSGSRVSKTFKGKLFYDPDYVKNLTVDEDVSVEEDFEKITEYDTSNEKVIVFLEDIDPLAAKDWTSSNDSLERITMVNKESGIILSLQPRQFHDTMIECELKLSCLVGDIADVLPLFSECKTIFEISNMAQQLLGTSSHRSSVAAANCLPSHKAAFRLLDIEIAAYEEEMKNTILAVDDYCNVCFGSGVQLDYCSCGEGFCKSCWSMYLSSITEFDKFICCPGYDCSAPVPVSILAWFLPNQQLSEYMTSIVEHSVKTNYNVHQCQRAICSRIIFTNLKAGSDRDEDSGIKCVCGMHWCRWCSQEYHYPSSCKEKQEYTVYENKLNEWKKLENNVEARACPKCDTKWEKMWGCNFMHCTLCNTGFCWGCGKEHDDYNGICGRITVPLEKVEILPFPTEELSRARIESFNLHSELKKDKVLHAYKRDYNLVLMKFLTADKEWFNANYTKDIPELIKTERGMFIEDILRRTFNLCKQGGLSLLNSLLKKSTDKGHQNKVRRYFFVLRNTFDGLINYKPTLNDWEPYLRRLDYRTKLYEKSLKVKLA